MKNTLCYIIFQNQRGCGHEAVCGTDFPRKRRRSDHFPAHYAQHLFYVSAVQSCFPIAGGFFFRQMHPLHPGVHGYISRLLFQDRTDFKRLMDSHNLACGSFGSGFAAPCTPLGILVRTTGCHHLCQLYSGGENPLASGQFRSEHPNRHPDQ